MYAEAFHRVFKRLYLKGKINKRVDTCLVNLQKYARDMGFDRLIKITKGKMTYRMNVITQRHHQSLTLPVSSVESLGNGKWKVLSENGKTYQVTQTAPSCPDMGLCNMACTECHVCIHTFQCTCPDSLIMSTICKHIHLVKRSTLNDGAISHDENATASVTFDKQQEEIETVLKCIRSRSDDISKSKSRIKGILLQLLEDLDKSTTSVSLTQLEKQLMAARSLFISSKSEKEPDVIPLKSQVNAPANKKMETQPRFYSTKKRCRKAKVQLARTTFDEQQAFLMDIAKERSGKTVLVARKDLNEGTCSLISAIDSTIS